MKNVKIEKLEMNTETHIAYKAQTVIKRRKKSEGYEYVCTATDADAD